MEENCSSTYLRCLSLAPGKRLSAKKSPALPLLEKKHRVVELSWTWPWSARCTGPSKLYVHISDLVYCTCAYAAQPEFCGCNLNKLEGQNVFVFTGCVSPEYSNCNKVGLTTVFSFLLVESSTRLGWNVVFVASILSFMAWLGSAYLVKGQSATLCTEILFAGLCP